VKALLQRVSEARVEAEGRCVGSIGKGILVLLGVEREDGPEAAERLARKTAELRIFDDTEGQMNLSVSDVGGGVLVVSQFTLAARTSKGRRPSFIDAAPPELAREYYEAFAGALRRRGLPVETGRFQTSMKVHIVNDGPVTFLLEA
jgi:D-tyrosyl-tRNA(Tyr) deacylase